MGWPPSNQGKTHFSLEFFKQFMKEALMHIQKIYFEDISGL